MNLKIIFLITLLIIALSMGCITNPDTDRDGHSDDVDEFPANPKYHATCSECDGSGIITRAREKDVEHTSEGHCKNRGIFSPDYSSTVTVTNTDSTGGIFEVYEWAEDNGVKMWGETQKSYIAPGNSHTFKFRYDADERMDYFYHRVTPPTYVDKVQTVCRICGGTGKI